MVGKERMKRVSDTKEREDWAWQSTNGNAVLGRAGFPISLVECVKDGCRNRANTDGRYDYTRKWRGKQHASESRRLRGHGRATVESHAGAGS
jgi:hypothetical protein